MPTFRSFEAFGRELQQLERDLATDEKARITKDMGERAQRIAHDAASADLGGDPKFSGWAPTLDTQLFHRGGVTTLAPTKTSAGPWTVAEIGRNKGNAGGFAGPGVGRSGTTSRTKSGAIRKVRTFKKKRWNGYTAGKGSASQAFAIMERELPKIAERGVARVIRKHFD
jgi:hypothetical protein